MTAGPARSAGPASPPRRRPGCPGRRAL